WCALHLSLGAGCAACRARSCYFLSMVGDALDPSANPTRGSVELGSAKARFMRLRDRVEERAARNSWQGSSKALLPAFVFAQYRLPNNREVSAAAQEDLNWNQNVNSSVSDMRYQGEGRGQRPIGTEVTLGSNRGRRHGSCPAHCHRMGRHTLDPPGA